ncbi:hypothetical protein CDO52_18410 [Nocardiopsis gilva YIM 90087]|uniref:Uncharacterized protein n=1 Tax=Nocardiopsis gilva YIM 90087 TaxID=1235441 RepID=A0A223SDX7_9ACTN|nr:hypothetical protein [Nocardiopsis gilva]ASU86296.1 hypothetical protein CDO52_18410 [Nocardiopsis gilva YIM 90087]
MDPVSLVLGAAIAFGGVLVGRMLPRRADRQALQLHQQQHHQQALSSSQRTPQPICGCGHHLVFHDQKTKMCQAQVVIPGRWTGQTGGTYRQCMCQGYRGPVPLDEYYAPDLLNDDG